MPPIHVAAAGVQAAADLKSLQSPETYVGYDRQANFASPETLATDHEEHYTTPASLQLNQWGLEGTWVVRQDDAGLASPSGKLFFRFHARDVHLVLGPSKDGNSDTLPGVGRWPAGGADAGVDVDAAGAGVVTEHRLYQLIRQRGAIEDRTLQIEFLDPGVEAFAFTFG